VTIRFDPLLTSMGEVQAKAETHCQQYGKDAVPQHEDSSFGGVRSVSFRCVARQ
jgi:hypothetical protein